MAHATRSTLALKPVLMPRRPRRVTYGDKDTYRLAFAAAGMAEEFQQVQQQRETGVQAPCPGLPACMHACMHEILDGSRMGGEGLPGVRGSSQRRLWPLAVGAGPRKQRSIGICAAPGGIALYHDDLVLPSCPLRAAGPERWRAAVRRSQVEGGFQLPKYPPHVPAAWPLMPRPT